MAYNLKKTVSHNQPLPDSNIPLPDTKNTVKKVMSNYGAIEIKPKIKTDQKAYQAKVTNYKSSLKNFISTYNHLIASFKSMKNSLTDKNDLECDEMWCQTITNIIEKELGIQLYPKSKATLKKDHQRYVSNRISTPAISLVLNSTSGHTKLHLAIKEAYEYVEKIISEISDVNMKYHFWLTMIMQPNEFHDLCDVREYLIENMCDKEQHEQLEFNNLYNGLQCKLINIANEIDEILEPNKTAKDNNINKIDEPKELNKKAKIEYIKEYKHKMDMKIKNLQAENEKLKVIESDYCEQIKALLGELAFRNRKLTSVNECLASLIKDKGDLITMIGKMEVKEVGFQSLQRKVENEQETNKRLRTIIDEDIENKFGSDV